MVVAGEWAGEVRKYSCKLHASSCTRIQIQPKGESLKPKGIQNAAARFTLFRIQIQPLVTHSAAPDPSTY